MEITTEALGDFILARPSAARLDAAAAGALRGATADLANRGCFRVALDLGQVEFVDSSGLGALIHMHKSLESQGRLVLCGLQPKVAQLLKVTRLDRVFSVAANVEEAERLLKT